MPVIKNIKKKRLTTTNIKINHDNSRPHITKKVKSNLNEAISN